MYNDMTPENMDKIIEVMEVIADEQHTNPETMVLSEVANIIDIQKAVTITINLKPKPTKVITITINLKSKSTPFIFLYIPLILKKIFSFIIMFKFK